MKNMLLCTHYVLLMVLFGRWLGKREVSPKKKIFLFYGQTVKTGVFYTKTWGYHYSCEEEHDYCWPSHQIAATWEPVSEALGCLFSHSPVSICGSDGKPRRPRVKRRHRVLLFWESNEASRLHHVECCSITVDYLLNKDVSCLKMFEVLLSRVWPRISPGRVSGHRNQVFGLAQCQQPQQYAQWLPCRGH